MEETKFRLCEKGKHLKYQWKHSKALKWLFFLL